jgi:hypothetical protein
MYGEIRVAARAGRALSCPDAVPRRLPTTPFERHRGGGHPPTPATPPCVRVRTRRFELVALAPIDALSVVRSHISLSELKVMGKLFILEVFQTTRTVLHV